MDFNQPKAGNTVCSVRRGIFFYHAPANRLIEELNKSVLKIREAKWGSGDKFFYP